ncbi:MAG: ATP-binding cassette domain-containing protein [Clostridia bacterium]
MSSQTDFNNFSDTLVSIKNVDKTFNKGSVNEVSLFKGFSLDIIKNQFVSVVGSNGSGKTTLLNLICGNMETDTGNIYLKDRNITNLKEHQRAKFIGRVFQDPSKGTCSNLTILENMSLADNKNIGYSLRIGVNKKRKDYYCSQLQLLKLGLENKLDQQVGTLSGGQRQALALLISTMTPIDLLILDEHTAALDPKSSENVMELTDHVIKEKKITTLMVTHNLKYAVNYGNRIIMMHDGKCVVDAAGEKKHSYEISDLLKIFNEISIECGN